MLIYTEPCVDIGISCTCNWYSKYLPRVNSIIGECIDRWRVPVIGSLAAVKWRAGKRWLGVGTRPKYTWTSDAGITKQMAIISPGFTAIPTAARITKIIDNLATCNNIRTGSIHQTQQPLTLHPYKDPPITFKFRLTPPDEQTHVRMYVDYLGFNFSARIENLQLRACTPSRG